MSTSKLLIKKAAENKSTIPDNCNEASGYGEEVYSLLNTSYTLMIVFKERADIILIEQGVQKASAGLNKYL